MESKDMRYALVTPARNEEACIHQTIESVVRQNIRPVKWVIVSDGSTDRTDEIVGEYVRQHEWMELIRISEPRERNFACKVSCFNRGYEIIEGLHCDFVGSLDADISFGKDYFAFLLSRFSEDPLLGIAGTPFTEEGRSYDYRFTSIAHVSGACQLFRRECFEAIGGYLPLKGGGIDVMAVIAARAKGWRTRTFTEMTCKHHRPMGTATNKSRTTVNFRLGQRAYSLGWHPVWQLVRGVYQMSRPPYVVAGCALMLGYLWALVTRADRPIAKELIEFQRHDQMLRLRDFLTVRVRGMRAGKPLAP